MSNKILFVCIGDSQFGGALLRQLYFGIHVEGKTVDMFLTSEEDGDWTITDSFRKTLPNGTFLECEDVFGGHVCKYTS